ncbi:MAG: translation elongation factor Ts [Spirochaetales bacterium]|nr:translation elongation factor Ts [Spirochaetales bacterium]
MEIKAQDVKNLREATGAGMMDCKKALVTSNGDFKKAEKYLKEQGLAAAQKRAHRATNEGRIFSRVSPDMGILLELSCETDFVAKNKDFIALGEKLVAIINDKKLTAPSDELEACVKDVIAVIKENLVLRRFEVLKAGQDELLVQYIHGEGRIGVIVKLKVSEPALKENEKVKQTAFDLALHVAAFAPLYLSAGNVEEEYMKEQEEIFMKQAEKTGKPENVLKGIVKGKMNKHLADICLLDQAFVKDEKKNVASVLKDLGKEVGGNIEITDYLYFKIGSE